MIYCSYHKSRAAIALIWEIGRNPKWKSFLMCIEKQRFLSKGNNQKGMFHFSFITSDRLSLGSKEKYGTSGLFPSECFFSKLKYRLKRIQKVVVQKARDWHMIFGWHSGNIGKPQSPQKQLSQFLFLSTAFKIEKKSLLCPGRNFSFSARIYQRFAKKFKDKASKKRECNYKKRPFHKGSLLYRLEIPSDRGAEISEGGLFQLSVKLRR